MGGFDGLLGVSGGAARCPPVPFLVWAAFAAGLASVFIKHRIQGGEKKHPKSKNQNLLPRLKLL